MLFFLIMLVLGATQYFFHHWWIAMAVPFVLAMLLSNNGWKAFFSGFFAVALVWLGYSFLLNIQNEGLLAQRIAKLFSLPSGDFMLLVTSLIGGIVGGFGALAGYSLKSFWFKKERKFKQL